MKFNLPLFHLKHKQLLNLCLCTGTNAGKALQEFPLTCSIVGNVSVNRLIATVTAWILFHY